MSRESRKDKAVPDHFEWDKESLKRANMDAAQGAALAQGLSTLAEKRQAEEMDEAWQEAQQMLAIWTPHVPSILKQLRKKGVEVDALRALLEQSALEQKPAQRERLAKEFSGQRELILEAISEVTDIEKLERQIRAVVSKGGEGCFSFDSVLAVTGRKEE
jgi:hypothetical protein